MSDPLLAGEDWSAVAGLWQPFITGEDPGAQAYLAYLVLWCFDAPHEVDETMREYLRAAAGAGHADAMYWMTSMCLAEGAAGDELLLRAGELGSRGAQHRLGALYATGDWTGSKDPARAVHWYSLAAEGEHDEAQYNLGFMYVKGEGTAPDPSEGLRWLHRSAGHGNTSAMRLLSDLYRNGYYSVPVRLEESERWLRLFQENDEYHRLQKKGFYLHDLNGSL
jgi:TPR repeat protein